MKKNHYLKAIALLCMVMGSLGAWADNVNATLVHTAGAQWGSNTGASTVDAEKEHYNQNASGGWAGSAYAKFSFTIPTGHTITAATLTYGKLQFNNSQYADNIYYMKKDFDLTWETFAGQTGTDLRNADNQVWIVTTAAHQGAKNTGVSHTGIEVDVTNAVQTLYAAGQNYILFQWTGNTGSADLYGKGSTNAPTLVITTADASSTTSYTVNFLDASDNSIVLKDPVVYSNAVVGATADATDADKATFYNTDESKKYVYKENTTAVLVANAASNSINVYFDAYDKISYTVEYKHGETSMGSTTPTSAYSDGTTTVYWNKYMQDGDTWYETSAPYGKAITEASNVVDYPTQTDITYFFEMEMLDRDGGSATVIEENINYSNNQRARISKGATLYTPALAGGIYELIIPWENSNNAANEVYVYSRTPEGDLSTEKLATFTAPKGSGVFAAVIEVPDGCSLALNGNEGEWNNNARMDYMTLTLAPVVNKVSNAALEGYKTFYSATANYKVDKNTTIYIAKVDEAANKVTLSPMDTKIIPQYCAVILKTSDTENYEITLTPTTEEADWDAFAENELAYFHADEDQPADPAYVLGTGSQGLGFYLPNSLIAGDIYITVAAGTGAPIRFVVEDEATAIKGVDAAKKNGAVYNVAGQRVNESYKGIVVKDGKKYLQK